MNIRVNILSILLFVICNLTSAQFKFEPLKTEFGQSLNYDVLRDHQGFLWIANDGVGLLKHNSYNSIRYIHNVNDSTSLIDDGILAIKQDSLKNIWVATRKGLCKYQPLTA